MARSFEDLVRLGAHQATHKLVEQADVSAKLARTGATELGPRFAAARIDRIVALRGEVAAGGADREVATSDKTALTQAQYGAFGDGKDWVRDVRDTAGTVFDGDDAILDAYTGGPKIGRSVPRLRSTMDALIKLAKRDAMALAAEGFDAAEIARGEQSVGRLGDTNAMQEAAIKALPPRTQEFYAKKAELYLLLKALERAARRTWRHDPARAASFRLTLLGRGGTHIERPLPTPTPPR